MLREEALVPSPVAPHLPPKPKPLMKPKAVEAPAPPPPPPPPVPPNRSSSTGSRKSSTKASSAKSDKPAKPKRSRSKSGVSASPRAKKKKVDATAAAANAAAADAASQARSYMQQHVALYGQQQRASQVSMEQQAAHYSPSYIKQIAQSQASLQGLAPTQLQQTMAAQQQQLLPQPPYGSPQQFQQQQRQLAQMRMMQQQQGRPGFPQQQPNMQFFNPAAMQAYGSQQPPMSLPGRGASAPMGAPPGTQRRTGEDNRNDPLFMLPDLPPPPPPPGAG